MQSFFFVLLDYPDFSSQFTEFQNSIKYEDGEEIKYRPQEPSTNTENGRNYSNSQEEGEYDESQDY